MVLSGEWRAGVGIPAGIPKIRMDSLMHLSGKRTLVIGERL